MNADDANNNFLDYLIDNLPHCIFWKDKNLIFQGCNKQFAQQFGYENSRDIIGKTDDDFPWATNLKDKYVGDDSKILQTGVSKLNYEEKQKQLDGSIKTVLVSKVPTRGKNNEITGILGIYTDITERKKMEEQLKQSKEEAELANEVKSQFISNMEHDLRTPCSGIAEMTNLLEQREIDHEKKEILHHISQASTKLLNILNSILTFDQVESGITPVTDKKIKIKNLIDDIITIELPSALVKKLKLTINYDSNIPQTIIGDEQRISRILLNIISNAIKFTPKGFVAISIKMPKKIDKKNAILQITIEDTGIGIPSNKLQYIYERFTRVSPANKNRYKGTGLGLSIVKRFIEDIEGEIDVESTLGEGTKFICTFPIKLPILNNETIETTLKNTKTTSSTKRKHKILLVEDDPLAQIVASTILKENFTDHLDIASSGKDAIKLANKNKYDLIFMDIGLPDITGYEVTQKIRNSKTSKNNKTKIIALTAHDTAQEKENSRAAGMNNFLIKPLNTKKIKRVLQKL